MLECLKNSFLLKVIENSKSHNSYEDKRENGHDAGVALNVIHRLAVKSDSVSKEINYSS